MSKKDFYESDAWHKIREWVISNCSECIKCGSRDNLTVHHKHYKTFGGKETLEDLEVLCAKCHHGLHWLEESYWINIVNRIDYLESKKKQKDNKEHPILKAFSSPVIKPKPIDEELQDLYEQLQDSRQRQGLDFVVIHDCLTCHNSKSIGGWPTKYECSTDGKYGCYPTKYE